MAVGRELNATTTEQEHIIPQVIPQATLMVSPMNGDIKISINDNQNFVTIQAMEVIPFNFIGESIRKIYYKTLSGTATLRYWFG